MQFWTKDEYLRFSEAISDKPLAFYAFEVLYWMGIRCGELMALTPSDFLMETSELRINKSYQRLRGEDVITKPKTRKSVRTIKMPAFLRDEMAEFIEMRDDVAPDERLFGFTKHFLVHEMDRGCKASGVTSNWLSSPPGTFGRIASYWPDASDRVTTPILLPLLVRRSYLSSTVAASLAVVAPCLTERTKSTQRGAFSFCSTFA